MKLSVYVPDELWDRVKELHPDQTTSLLVQAALLKYAGHLTPRQRLEDRVKRFRAREAKKLGLTE